MRFNACIRADQGAIFSNHSVVYAGLQNDKNGLLKTEQNTSHTAYEVVFPMRITLQKLFCMNMG